MNDPNTGGPHRTGAATQRRNRAWLRWVPALAAPAVIAAGVLVGSIPARAGDALADKTPADVLALLAGHKTHTFSGTVEQASDLGLPELPATGPGSGSASDDPAASAMEMLTGEHTARIFMNGKSKVRIQVVDRFAERDVIRRDNDVWFYSSKDNSTAHLTLPAHARDLPLSDPALPGTSPESTSPDSNVVPPTPQDLAVKFLAAADSSTAVSVGPDVQVAGRAAYNLVLEPRTSNTLVGMISIAVDGETGMPLSVEVTARGAGEPAFRTGFTSLSLDAPDAALFNFVPPPGSTVEELQLQHPTHQAPGQGSPGYPGAHTDPEQLAAGIKDKAGSYLAGTGWETVVELPAETGAGEKLSTALAQNPLLGQAAVVVPGGRLLSSALFNVLLTDDGRVYAGMVPADRLQAASSAP
ncbi:LolA family protein [Pseudarthrobacter quantipunctorum]|uniref:Outer membrane lipoprotein-sorting protein n=1 Tax=Pseudarthrobacter quantipunctorum TaxID=3128980 RepID=A0ABZ2R387_9MICC